MAEFKDIFIGLRKEKGHSQLQAAERLNVSKSTVAMWETGKRMPQRIALEAIADLYNVDMDYLCGKTDVKRRIAFGEDGKVYASVPAYSSDMIEVIELYSKINEEQKGIVLSLLRSFNAQR